MLPKTSNSSSTGLRGNRTDEAVEGSLGTDDVESVDGVSAKGGSDERSRGEPVNSSSSGRATL